VEVIELKTELEPLAVALPPAPTVTVYVVPAVTDKPVAVLKPPAPPPPPLSAPVTALPPPPPPATTRYSTCVAPTGAVHVPEDLNTVT
jgi:hypothetical protein